MHVLWWILGGLAVLIVLLCLTRVGALVVLKDGSATVDVRVSVFRIRVYPKKEKPEKEKKEKKNEGGKKKKSFPKPALEDIKDAAKTLWPPLKKAVGRVRRGIRISPMDVSLTLGGLDDPAKTSELYGYLHSGMWSVMPVLEEGLDIPDHHIHIGIDFNTERTVVEGELGLWNQADLDFHHSLV